MNSGISEVPMAENAPSTSAGCSYQGYEFGAGRYPDSVCIGGRLHDADACDDEGNMYEPDEDIPCPMCKPQGALDYWTQRNRSAGHSKRKAESMAQSLVADIRANRGVTEMTSTGVTA